MNENNINNYKQMKRIFWIAMGVTSLITASCHKEQTTLGVGTEAVVAFTVAVPDGLETKAMSQAENADIVYYEVWNADWTKQLFPIDNSALASEPVQNKKATIELSLVVDQTYNFIFWACNEACNAYDVSELKNVKVNYATIASQGNQDKFDAFYAVEDIVVTGPINETITLYRPFSQLNFGSSKMESSFGPIEVGETVITVTGLATAFNTIEGKGHTLAAEPVSFKAKGLATDEKLSTSGADYTWITMDYMFMMDDKSIVDVKAELDVVGIGKVTHEVPSVTLQKNHRTNILGTLFTADANLQIVIDPDFNKPDHNVYVPNMEVELPVQTSGEAVALESVLEEINADPKALNYVIDLKGETATWTTGGGHGSTPFIPEDSPIETLTLKNGTLKATGAGVGPIRLANGGKLVLDGITVVDESVSYAENNWEFGYLEFAGILECRETVFEDPVMFSGEEAYFSVCTFKSVDEDSEYSVWVDNGTVSFTGCLFQGYRGLKMHEDYGSEIKSVLVDGCTFDKLSKKPGIAIGTLNAATKVTIRNSKFIQCQAGDQGLYIYETDTDVTTFDFTNENNIVE